MWLQPHPGFESPFLRQNKSTRQGAFCFGPKGIRNEIRFCKAKPTAKSPGDSWRIEKRIPVLRGSRWHAQKLKNGSRHPPGCFLFWPKGIRNEIRFCPAKPTAKSPGDSWRIEKRIPVLRGASTARAKIGKRKPAPATVVKDRDAVVSKDNRHS